MIVEVERTNTTDQKRNLYKVTIPPLTGVQTLGQNKYLWAKFMPGQKKIKCEAEYKFGELRIGKVI